MLSQLSPMAYIKPTSLKSWRAIIKEHRLHKRVNAEEKCILQLRNEYYPATVKNISFGGALVHPYTTLAGLHVGDCCNVSMNGEFLREYSCEVARVETATIALKFTGRRILIADKQRARMLIK